MHSALALLVLTTLIATPTHTQWDEGVAALMQVDAFQLPDGDAVWTDMRPVPMVASEDELVAANGATLYAGPIPGTLSLDAWRERLGRRGAIDCLQAQTVCAVRIDGEARAQKLLVPFGIGRAPGFLMQRVPRFTLSSQQAATLRAHRIPGLVLGDGNVLSSTSEGTHLLSTHPDNRDCNAPGVQCGVVFEIEVADHLLNVLLF